jgi:hypothetical protein
MAGGHCGLPPPGTVMVFLAFDRVSHSNSDTIRPLKASKLIRMSVRVNWLFGFAAPRAGGVRMAGTARTVS